MKGYGGKSGGGSSGGKGGGNATPGKGSAGQTSASDREAMKLIKKCGPKQ